MVHVQKGEDVGIEQLTTRESASSSNVAGWDGSGNDCAGWSISPIGCIYIFIAATRPVRRLSLSIEQLASRAGAWATKAICEVQ